MFSPGVIPKSVKAQHIKDNISLTDFHLSEHDMEVLGRMHSNTRFCWDPTRVKWLRLDLEFANFGITTLYNGLWAVSLHSIKAVRRTEGPNWARKNSSNAKRRWSPCYHRGIMCSKCQARRSIQQALYTGNEPTTNTLQIHKYSARNAGKHWA